MTPGTTTQPGDVHFLRRAFAAPFRSGAGGASSVRSTSDLEHQLRHRLLFMLIVGEVFLGLFLFAGLAMTWRSYVASPGGLFTRPPLFGDLFLVWITGGVIGWVLWRSGQLSLRKLRALEWVIYVPAYVAGAALTVVILRAQLADLRGMPVTYGTAFAMPWVIGGMTYGILIPNTWQRCAAAIGLSMLFAFIPDVAVLTSNAIPFAIAERYLGMKILLLCWTAVLAVYGSHRIDVLQADAAAARTVGQYVLKEQLGAGGMGEVHLAEHQLLRRPCAVKLIRHGQHGDASAFARFEREVQTTATLTHPNTVQIFDYGHTDDGTFFYAMEYLPGTTLDALVEREGPLAPARVVHFLVQLCGALREAHGRGLIHRDIKPSNVIICERGGVPDVAKLLDFGLVAAIDREADEAKLTQAGLVVGTPAFMSPEQCRGGEELSAASDIYSVGALGYYLLTGKVLFPGRSPVQMIGAHVYEVPTRMADAGVAVPPELEAVIFRCLAKQPADRFADAAQLSSALLASVA